MILRFFILKWGIVYNKLIFLLRIIKKYIYNLNKLLVLRFCEVVVMRIRGVKIIKKKNFREIIYE